MGDCKYGRWLNMDSFILPKRVLFFKDREIAVDVQSVRKMSRLELDDYI